MINTFKDNKYSKWYFNIISNAGILARSKKDRYYESHHVLPKSCGGTNEKINLVLLTPREHFLCHLLLPKIMIDPIQTGKMVYAFFRFKGKHKNSRLFDKFRIAYGKLTVGKNNPFYGRTHTNETKRKISRLGKYHTAASRKQMSESKKGKLSGKNNPMFGKTHPSEWRKLHSERLSGNKHFNYGKPAFTKGRIWINNHIISKMIHPMQLQVFLTQDWIKGRLPQ